MVQCCAIVCRVSRVRLHGLPVLCSVRLSGLNAWSEQQVFENTLYFSTLPVQVVYTTRFTLEAACSWQLCPALWVFCVQR